MITTSESLCRAFGYLTMNELKALKILAQMLPDNPVIVNIGAGSGTSGLAFLESRPDLFLYTVDIEDGDTPLGSLLAESNAVKAAGFVHNQRGNPKNRGLQICYDSNLLGRHWEGSEDYDHGKLDMVFVDADHSYEGCRGDIEAWLPNIKPGGIIALHDYRKHEVNDPSISPKPWPGVDMAVEELLTGKYEQILRVDSLVAFRVLENNQ